MNKIYQMKDKDILEEVLSQIYETSHIAGSKHNNLNRSYARLAVSIIAMLIYLMCLSVI